VEEYEWDVFVSHAYADKTGFVRPLAKALKKKGLRVWYDEFTLQVGDSLRASIESGLSQCHYGVVVISPAFFEKDWPQRELNALVGRERGRKRVLPVWHNIDAEGIRVHSPVLADRLATSSAKGLGEVVKDLMAAGLAKLVERSEQPKACAKIDLCRPLKKSRLSARGLKRCKVGFYLSTHEDMAPEITERLEKDRSKESVQLLFEFATTSEPMGDGSYATGSLARVGKGAVPWIVKVLKSKNQTRVWVMLDQVIGLCNYIDVDARNYVDFLTYLVSQPDFPELLQRLERWAGKPSVDNDFKNAVGKLRACCDMVVQEP
jgi:hypothetical protein